MKQSLLILSSYLFLSYGAELNSIPKIEISNLIDCEDQKVTPPEGLVCETEIVGEGMSKAFIASVTIPFIDNSLKYKTFVKMWNEGKWHSLDFPLTGDVCEDAHKYLPALWEKLAKAANVTHECPVKAGNYSVKNFTAEASDLKLPFVVSGKFLVSALVLKNDIPVVCKQLELTITES